MSSYVAVYRRPEPVTPISFGAYRWVKNTEQDLSVNAAHRPRLQTVADNQSVVKAEIRALARRSKEELAPRFRTVS